MKIISFKKIYNQYLIFNNKVKRSLPESWLPEVFLPGPAYTSVRTYSARPASGHGGPLKQRTEIREMPGEKEREKGRDRKRERE